MYILNTVRGRHVVIGCLDLRFFASYQKIIPVYVNYVVVSLFSLV